MPMLSENWSCFWTMTPPQSGCTQASMQNWLPNSPLVNVEVWEPLGLLESRVDMVLPSGVRSPSFVCLPCGMMMLSLTPSKKNA